MSCGAKSLLLRLQGELGSSLAFDWSKIAAPEAGMTSQISSSNSLCKAWMLRVELIMFAIWKNAVRSRAIRPTHESPVGSPQRSRDIVLNSAVPERDDGSVCSSGPVRNTNSLL